MTFSLDNVKQGSMIVLDKDGNFKFNCPLKHTSISARVSGFITRAKVIQHFKNTLKETVEAVYVFPLPHNAAVDSMTMNIGNRIIKSVMKKKEVARKMYEAAKAAGKGAGLLEQQRPNIFTQSVANIMPGDEIEVHIEYVEFLDYEDGRYRFVFPMVVMPRYIPGAPTGYAGTGWAPDTNKVPDASKITPVVAPPGIRAGHDISIAVEIDAGFTLTNIVSKLHEIEIKKVSSSKAIVQLKEKNEMPNKDFVLEYTTAEARISSTVLAHASKKGKFFTVIVQPPERMDISKVTPKEMIFVVDDSGSMGGGPINKVKETMLHCINKMNLNDTFQVISFSNNVTKLFNEPQKNTPVNRALAKLFIANLTGRGGTEMLRPVLDALSPPYSKRLRIVCMMTDGGIGNDFEIINAIKKNRGNARFFVMSIGNATNRYLIDKMAEVGRGQSLWITSDYKGKNASDDFYKLIANPLFTDIDISFRKLSVSDIYPVDIPDLFSSKPVVICGKYNKAGSGEIVISGKVAGKEHKIVLKANLPTNETENNVLATLWARKRIDDLMSRNYLEHQYGQDSPNIGEIIKTAIKYNIMSQYTSFVAIEQKIVNKGGKQKTVAVPTEMPEGMDYEGFFGRDERYLACCFDMSFRKADPMLYRIRAWQTKTATPVERNLVFALAEIKRVAAVFSLAKTIEEDAEKIYKDAVKRGLLRGKCMEIVIAAAIFAACKKHKINMPLETICSAFPVDKNDADREYKLICRKLNLKD